jgi:hypothetical protein
VVIGVRPRSRPHQLVARPGVGRRIVQRAPGRWEPGSGPHHDRTTNSMAAAARVDGSGTGHAAGGIKGQALTTTTTRIIAAESAVPRLACNKARPRTKTFGLARHSAGTNRRHHGELGASTFQRGFVPVGVTWLRSPLPPRSPRRQDRLAAVERKQDQGVAGREGPVQVAGSPAAGCQTSYPSISAHAAGIHRSRTFAGTDNRSSSSGSSSCA